jgi:hypothetical protein
MGIPLIERAVTAYGGAERWNNSSRVELVSSASGLLFTLKWLKPFVNAKIIMDTHRPMARIEPVDQEGRIGILEGKEVRLEDAQGNVVESRPDANTYFPWGRHLLWWDNLDKTYFAGYAMWTYFTLPALLLDKNIKWRELSQTTLEAEFPAEYPAHSKFQYFHFDQATGLLTRTDYTAEAIFPMAKAAHKILEHKTWDGITYTSKRRVTPMLPGGFVSFGPTLVYIEVDSFKLI